MPLGDADIGSVPGATGAGRTTKHLPARPLSAAPGAIGGRVVTAPDLTPSVERTRLAELAYLPGDFIDEARAIVADLKARYPNVRMSYSALRTAAVVAARAGRT